MVRIVQLCIFLCSSSPEARQWGSCCISYSNRAREMAVTVVTASSTVIRRNQTWRNAWSMSLLIFNSLPCPTYSLFLMQSTFNSMWINEQSKAWGTACPWVSAEHETNRLSLCRRRCSKCWKRWSQSPQRMLPKTMEHIHWRQEMGLDTKNLFSNFE